jgi:hypothetical protein
MAIPRQVNAGRRTKFFVRNRTWTLGDRAYALIDKETGKVASAKNPRKWEKLFDFHSVFLELPQVAENIPPVRITLPNGVQIFSDQDENVDHTLSKALGRDVKLTRADLEKPSYKEYWPNIEGLAQREKVTDETMPPPNFLRYCRNPYLDNFYN